MRLEGRARIGQGVAAVDGKSIFAVGIGIGSSRRPPPAPVERHRHALVADCHVQTLRAWSPHLERMRVVHRVVPAADVHDASTLKWPPMPASMKERGPMRHALLIGIAIASGRRYSST